MLKYWLWLASRRNLSPREQLAVLRHFGTPEAAYCAEKSALSEVEGLRSTASLEDKSLMEPEEILNECYRKQISILTYQDAAYPDRLRSIDDPPMVLYYQGTVPAIDTEPVIAVVGTRKASAYGLVQAKQLGYQLGRMGAVVVSGGADGIDTMAMKGALTAGAPVIGVLGCGVDVVYPAANRGLFEDVRARGWLVSEYPPGTAAIGTHFPVRNRILSALSLGVLVGEAPEKSGALITARRALEQGRDVFALPANVDSATCAGNLRLLRGGGGGGGPVLPLAGTHPRSRVSSSAVGRGLAGRGGKSPSTACSRRRVSRPGSRLPCSIMLMVVPPTPHSVPSCRWVRPSCRRSWRSLMPYIVFSPSRPRIGAGKYLPNPWDSLS